jgi:hypothetical protein
MQIDVVIHADRETSLFDSPEYFLTAWQIARHSACRVRGIQSQRDDPKGYDDQVAISVDADRFDVEIEQLVRDAISTNIGARSFAIRERT